MQFLSMFSSSAVKNIQTRVFIKNSYTKPLERQVREGVEILGIKDTDSMNSKVDHIQPALRRIGFLGLLEDEDP